MRGLREEAPIYYNERYDFWAISRHSDVERALANWEVFSNRRSDILELIQSKFDMPGGVMMFQDPPEHTRLRGLMSRVFTPRRMAELEDQIRRYCVRCLDPLVGSGGFDIIAELASMMPMRVIGMLLGIPESEQISVRDANDANLRTKPGAPLKVADADSIADGRIYADYVEWRSKNPSDDLMTTLLNVEFDDEHGVRRKLTRKEVLHYTQVVAGAGNETTGRLIGWLAKVLAEHPDQRREVYQDRSLLNRTIDETLRFEPTGPHVARWMAKDFECYGTTVPAGSAMLLLFGAANRDHRRYADPDTFNIHRDNISHITFGKGVHYCLGREPGPPRGPRRARRDPQPLARVGHRLRHSAIGADIDGARLGAAAGRAALRGRVRCTAPSPGCRHLESVKERLTRATASSWPPLVPSPCSSMRVRPIEAMTTARPAGGNSSVSMPCSRTMKFSAVICCSRHRSDQAAISARISLRWLASPMNSNSNRVSLGSIRVSQKACSGRSEANAFCWRSR